MTAARAIAGIALAVVCACGDNTKPAGDGGPPDAAPTVDARQTDCGDASDCAAEAYRPICHPEQRRCVECRASEDCGAGSLGNSCNERGECSCAGDGDCAGNMNGPLCHPEARACSCLVPDDCRASERCELTPYLGTSVRTCIPAPET